MSRRQTMALAAGGTLLAGVLAVGQPSVAHAAAFTVNSNLDVTPTGTCATLFTGTLRDCIAAANAAGGTNAITFGSLPGPIVLNNTLGELHITGSPTQTLTITGNGQASTIIDGNANQRVFEVNSGATVTMNDLTVRNGKFTNPAGFDGGAGIRDAGTLTLNRVTVTGNQALAASGADATSGGILDAGLGTLTIQSSTISNNIASSPFDAAGGGIQDCCVSGSHVTITDSTVSGNTATSTTGQAYGGAIANNSAVLTIARSVFSDNTVTQTSTVSGGGVGGSAIVSHAFVGVDQSTFHHNITTGANATTFASGAIVICCNGSGTLTVTATGFDNNSATAPGGADAGAIEVSGGVRASVSSSTFESNSANGPGAVGGALAFEDGSGTGALPIVNSTFTGNNVTGAGAFGGGIALSAGRGAGYALINDTVNGNGAPSGAGANLLIGRGVAVTIVNSIVSGSPTNNCHIETGGTLTDSGHNVDDGSTSTCGFSTAKSDVLGTGPKLGAVGNNGGSTRTEALLTGSPAIDAASNASCPTTDQRGLPRTSSIDTVCDIGAFEVQKAVVPTPAVGTGIPFPGVLLLILGVGAVTVGSVGRPRRRVARLDN